MFRKQVWSTNRCVLSTFLDASSHLYKRVCLSVAARATFYGNLLSICVKKLKHVSLTHNNERAIKFRWWFWVLRPIKNAWIHDCMMFDVYMLSLATSKLTLICPFCFIDSVKDGRTEPLIARTHLCTNWNFIHYNIIWYIYIIYIQ